jgi:hypothetical protein
MMWPLRTSLLATAIATAGILSTETASAQWGFGPPVIAESYSVGFGAVPRYYTPHVASYHSFSSVGVLHAPPAGIAVGAVRPYAVTPAIAPTPVFGGVVANPRARIKQDVYTPFGRQRVDLKVRRDGSARLRVR